MPNTDHIGLSDYESALARLRERLPIALRHRDVVSIVAARDEVLGHYGPVFRVDSPAKVNLDEFRAFLNFRNNRHWGLHRQSGSIFADPDKLRQALYILVDEGRPIQQRFDIVVSTVQGIGKAIITAVLLVAYPANMRSGTIRLKAR